MKVIKRDGRIVDYDKSKIKIAIEKANEEVSKKEKATKEDINSIIEYIEDLNKKRILVEDIQDIIEQKLMELGRYELSKKYIVYRYTRALIRKSNTTDASILGLIRNSNKNVNNSNALVSWSQRNMIVGEVSKDISKRILLPEKIVKAWDEGNIYFHDAEYFIQPIFKSCFVNMEDMLDNGTAINGKKIETPKSFQVACTIMTQIIAIIASNQYGEQAIDISCLGKYLRKSKEKYEKEIIEAAGKNINQQMLKKLVDIRTKDELKAGVQTIQYQINTQIDYSPDVTIYLNIRDNDTYSEENAMIIEEILRQRTVGIKNENGEFIITNVPNLVYVLKENNNLSGGKYDYLTKYAIECSLKCGFPNYVSEKYNISEKINLGVVTINLPQIAIIADGDNTVFWSTLEERCELCKEALMYRYYALLGKTAETSPIHWKYGAISRLKDGEKIDKMLTKEHSYLSLGYIGIEEMTKKMQGVSHRETDGKKFAVKVLEFLKNKITKWEKETGVGFSLVGVNSRKIGELLLHTDKEEFGTIEGITDKEFYTGSYHINEDIDTIQRIKIEAEFQKASAGQGISFINPQDILNFEENVKEISENGQYAVLCK